MRRFAATTAAALALSTLACGFLQDNSDITHRESIPVEFAVDATQLCQRSDIGNCNGPGRDSPRRQPLPRIERDLDVDVVERTGNEKLDDLAGRFKKITVTSIEYQVQSNSLSFDLPPIDLHLGPKPAGGRGDRGVFKLARLPEVPAGATRSLQVGVSDSRQDRASNQLKTLKLSAIPSGRPVIEKGQRLPPNGRATIKIILNVKFVANPVDAAT
ncbi:MAG: hypothetical protein ABEL76_06210 [Bradymonadaceae bacterium]